MLPHGENSKKKKKKNTHTHNKHIHTADRRATAVDVTRWYDLANTT